MSAPRRVTGLVLLALVAAAIAGLLWTRDREPVAGVDERPAGQPSKEKAPPRRERLVDTRTLLTARRMGALATTPEERELAQQADRLADHSADMAFVDAMRAAAESAPAATPVIRDLAAVKAKAQAALGADEQRIEQIDRRLAAGSDLEKERLQDQLEVAKAQRELDRDEVDAAAEELRKAGGDPQARVRRLRDAYEAAQKEPRPVAAPAPEAQSGSVLARYRAWAWQRAKLAQLAEARQEVLDKAQRMAKRRATLTERARVDSAADEAAKRDAAGEAAKRDTAAGVPRKLASLARRIQDEQDLGEVYGSWMALVDAHARAALHRLVEGMLWVLLILLAAVLSTRLIDRLFLGMARDQLRMDTLRTVVKFAAQLVAALVALFVVLGIPDQATTIIGLAGAGLTVAMKDFIVAFFGWFVLMRRNGIRVGDWVEIKGVGGEVAEIGLLHTVLLETGSWSDAGHPTGRRVSFVNSFAIEGHYFNFSTTGQWMWDELRLAIPAGQDPYPVIDGVQKLVEHETEANAKLAEQEWRKATTRYHVQTFSAVPAISVVPTSSGIEIVVRYITRAHERHETRRRLYQAVLELMHGKRAEVVPSGVDAA